MRHGNELVLFVYLVLERGRRVSRDEASVAIWPERRPEHESAALRTVLSRLRGVLGADVLGSADGLFLRLAEDTRVDVLEAQERVGAARRCSDPSQARDHVLQRCRSSSRRSCPVLTGPGSKQDVGISRTCGLTRRKSWLGRRSSWTTCRTLNPPSAPWLCAHRCMSPVIGCSCWC